MKRKNLLHWILCLIFLFFSVALYQYAPNFNIIKTWFIMNRSAEEAQGLDVLIQNKQKEIPLAHYYLMLAYKKINIDEAINIGELFLEDRSSLHSKSIYNKEKFLIQIFLAEMYFYKKAFLKSKNYYWLALLQEPENEVLRKNYEYTQKLSSLVELHKPKQKSTLDYVSNKDEATLDSITNVPLFIEKIMNRSNEFYLNTQEKQESSLNKW